MPGEPGTENNAPPAAPPAAPWYNGADAELVGHIQTKGWHELTPDKAALAAIAAHREAERFIGVPADRVLKLPAGPEDADGWRAVHNKLGVPEKPDGYDFSTLKGEDGQPLLDETETAFLRETAHRLNIPASTAVQLAQSFLKRDAETFSAEAADKTAKLAEEHKTLDASWGQNKEANLFLAKKGAEKLGLTPDNVDALEGIVGYAKVMEALRQVGELSGEARFISNASGFNNGIMTREQAIARKSELMADSSWAQRYLAGSSAEVREMTSLLTIITGDDTEASRRA